jgi:hypothetical protein
VNSFAKPGAGFSPAVALLLAWRIMRFSGHSGNFTWRLLCGDSMKRYGRALDHNSYLPLPHDSAQRKPLS